jgi:signal transduction histidine kinase/ligand-binding sensor domain-containing protein
MQYRAVFTTCAMLCMASTCITSASELPENGMIVTVWESDDELPNNDIHTLVHDHQGFLWAGTASGLVRFDGRTFRHPTGTDLGFFQAATTYSATATDPGTIVFVHDIDAMNRLLMVTPDGVSAHPADAILGSDERAAAVFNGGDGALWILATDRTWLLWKNGLIERFPPPPQVAHYTPPAALPLPSGRTLLSRGAGLEIHENGAIKPISTITGLAVALASANDGGAWIADRSGLHRMQNDGSITTTSLPLPEDTDWPPRLMHETKDGALWTYFRTAGLWRTDSTITRRVNVNHPIIRCLTEDNDGNLWVGTAGGGLNRIRMPAFHQWATDPIDTIGSICEDADGTLWLGNTQGIWQLANGRAIPPDSPDAWPSLALSLCPTPDGALWIGGANNIYRFRRGIDPHPLPVGPPEIDHALAMFRASDGSVWAGCESGPLLRFDSAANARPYGTDKGYIGDFAQVFGEDAHGTLWVGTRRGALFKFQDDHFTSIPTPLEATGTGILTITQGDGGALWLGTRGRGFLRYKDGQFRAVEPQQGLPDGIIAQTLAVNGRLWVGSSNSIFQISLAELDACADGLRNSVRPLRFGRGDGVNSFFATGQRQPCAWQSADGRLWFVGRKGVYSTNPEIWESQPAPPATFIDEVITDTKPSHPPFRLPSTNRRLEFRYTSPALSAPADLRFRYRLIGFDKEWSLPTSQVQVVYPRLPPGRYTFQVASSTRPDAWSHTPASTTITVMPAWWELIWLRALAALISVAAAIAIILSWANRRLLRKTAMLKQERKIESERARIARDLHDGIGSGLTQLGWLTADLRESPPAEANTQVDLISGKIRNLARDLDAAVWAVSPRHDTLGSLCAYLCEFAIEQFRHTPIRCRVSAPDNLPAGPLAPQIRNHLFMATREILNNILKHANAREVRLSIECAGGWITIEIRDDGCGFETDSALTSSRYGLRNIRDRLNEIGGDAAVFSQLGKGVQVSLRAPITS